MKIFLDFDGTVVEHEYPLMGRLVPHALRVVKRLQDAGHTIVLNTMRVEFNDGSLKKAYDYLYLSEEVDTEAIQHTLKKEHPHPWKPDAGSAELYIDDIASNIPLIACVMTTGKMVDWKTVEAQLESCGILPHSTVRIRSNF